MLPLIAKVILASLGNKIQRRIFISLASLSLLLTLVVQILITYPKIAFDDYRHPLADLMGWKEISLRITALAQGGDKVFIPNWSHASRVAWYARPMPVKVLDSRFDQFDLWFGSAEVGDSGILLLHADRKGFKEKLLEQFSRCEFKDEFEVKIESSYVNYFKLYRCDHYIGTGSKEAVTKEAVNSQ